MTSVMKKLDGMVSDCLRKEKVVDKNPAMLLESVALTSWYKGRLQENHAHRVVKHAV